MENEVWKDIPGFEGLYQASNQGRIRSLDREVRHNYGGTAVKKGKIITPHITQPYPGAELRWSACLTKDKHTKTIFPYYLQWQIFPQKKVYIFQKKP